MAVGIEVLYRWTAGQGKKVCLLIADSIGVSLSLYGSSCGEHNSPAAMLSTRTGRLGIDGASFVLLVILAGG